MRILSFPPSSLNLSSPSFQSLSRCLSSVMFLLPSLFSVSSACSCSLSKNSHDTTSLSLLSSH